MTRVLPEPAPARIRSGSVVCRTASRCSGLRVSRNCMNWRPTTETRTTLTSSRLQRAAVQQSRADAARDTTRASTEFRLLDRHALGKVPRLIDVAAAADGDVVRQQLQRHD